MTGSTTVSLDAVGAGGTTGERPDSATLRVLTFTTLFPNLNRPQHGLFVRERIRALARLCDLRIVAPIPWMFDHPWLPRSYRTYLGIPSLERDGSLQIEHPRFLVIPKILKTADGALMALSVTPQLRNLRERFPFQVVDAHWAYPDGVAGAALARYFGVPLALTVRGDDINIFGQEVGRGLSIRWALRQAAVVITVSNELKSRVQDLVGRAVNVVVIPNGVDIDKFRPRTRSDARKALGLPENARLLVSIGRLHESKGFPVLVEALGLLKNRFPDLSLLIVGGADGEADATPAIKTAAMRHGITDRIRLVGSQPVETLPDWYSAADLFCLATSREGSPNVILEALACGVPCVAPAVGGIVDVLSNRSLGRFMTLSPSGAAAAISEALSVRWNPNEIVAGARRRTWATVAAECLQTLAGLVPPAPRTMPEHQVSAGQLWR